VESAVCFAAMCLGSGIRASELKKLNNMIKKSGSVLGTALGLKKDAAKPSKDNRYYCTCSA